MNLLNVDKITEYSALVKITDKLPEFDIEPPLLGLFGEVGGILAAAKKLVREHDVYVAFNSDAIEEFGDALWYLTAIAHRLGVSLEEIYRTGLSQSKFNIKTRTKERYSSLLNLAESAGKFVSIRNLPEVSIYIIKFFAQYIDTMTLLDISFNDVLEVNIRKISGRFKKLDFSLLPRFDDDYEEDERLPDDFEFFVRQRKSGQTYISLNDVFIGEVFIGDPLTDNIAPPDGYKFHDVFHMANAAILHWSPVIRSLLKRKRKTTKLIDESQDGGRAIVIEEGLSAWIFSLAKNKHNMFRDAQTVPFHILKRISEFVDGYEVENCPQALWERAIIQGFEAFGSLYDKGSGIIKGSRKNRSICFRSMT